LADALARTGHAPVVTREPGGSPAAEAIRNILLSGHAREAGPLVETMLFYAARQDHLETVIRPALAAGRWVISDRFADSTRAYQGAAGGVPSATLDALDALVIGETRPDLTLILDLPPEAGLARAGSRGAADRFESEDLGFHRALRAALLAIAAREPGRCAVVDASRPVDEVAEAIRRVVEARLGP
jgi:dTMP kinase